MNERERAGATDGGVVTDNEPARARYDAELYLCVLLVRGGGARVEPEGGVVAAADGAEGARAEKARGDEARRGESHEEGHVVVVVSGAFGVVSMCTACGVRPARESFASWLVSPRLSFATRYDGIFGRSDAKPFRSIRHDESGTDGHLRLVSCF